MFGAVSFLSGKMVQGDSDEKVLCSCFFWLINATFGLLPCFLMSPNTIIMLNTTEKTTFKAIFQKIFGYTQVSFTNKKLYLA